ncbi:MAG: phospholipase D-like domain-containing protein [Candidatus Dormibacteria bacterium]
MVIGRETADQLSTLFLSDGSQPATEVLDRLVSYISVASTSLEIAIYDLNLTDLLASGLRAALQERVAAGVAIRLVYNGPRAPNPRYPPPPRSDPGQVEGLGVPCRSIPGVPDLMHHKYVIRDRSAVWTGSTNWTTDSWTREENLIVVVPSDGLAADYSRNFEELWQKGSVEASGHFDGQWATTAVAGQQVKCRAIFSPGRGRAMAHLYASRIGQARRRLRICSPVLTSGPVLASLAEIPSSVDSRVVYDQTQMDHVLSQWGAEERSAWKTPIFEAARSRLRCASKRSTPYAEGSVHDYMHAKFMVADDIVLTGSFNISHSGEMNAENVVEIDSADLADQLTEFADGLFARYGEAANAPATT